MNTLSAKSSGVKAKNQGTYVICRTKTESKYFGIAFAEAVIAGEKVQAPQARSIKTLPLDCGT